MIKSSFFANSRLRLVVLSALLACACNMWSKDKPRLEDSPEALSKLEQAIQWFDAGYPQTALPIYDELLEKYPDSTRLLYEKGMCLCVLGQYDAAKDIYEFLITTPDVSALEYSKLGECYDALGDVKKALEVFQKGYEKFPTESICLTEIGDIMLRYGNEDAATAIFENAMIVEPEFVYNYYKCANHLLKTDKPLWGLVYAETESLLDTHSPDRRANMAKGILDCYKKRIQLSDDNNISVRLSSGNLKLDSISGKFEPTFDTILELCYAMALTKMIDKNIKFDMDSFESLCAFRQLVNESYHEYDDNIFGDRMYLMEFQKKVIDAGHWEAYNWYLFSDALEFDCEKWRLAHPEAVMDFVNWYNNGNIFHLDANHSVTKAYLK